MAKESGIGWTTAARDVSGGGVGTLTNCTLNVDFATPRNTQDVTGLDLSSTERLLLLGDYSSTFTMAFNDAACKSFDVHKTVASADATRTETLVISGQTLPNEVLLTDMQLARGADGSFTIIGPAVLQSGIDPTWA